MSSSGSKSFLYFIESRSILEFTLYNNSEISLDMSSAFLVVDKLIIILTIYYTLYKNPVLIYRGFENYSPLKIPTSNTLPQWPLIIPQMGLIWGINSLPQPQFGAF